MRWTVKLSYVGLFDCGYLTNSVLKYNVSPHYLRITRTFKLKNNSRLMKRVFLKKYERYFDSSLLSLRFRNVFFINHTQVTSSLDAQIITSCGTHPKRPVKLYMSPRRVGVDTKIIYQPALNFYTTVNFEVIKTASHWNSAGTRNNPPTAWKCREERIRRLGRSFMGIRRNTS